MSDISDRIESLGTKPQRVKGDAGEVEQHPLSELIEADKYISGRTAADNPQRGLRFTKLIPRGTQGESC